MEETVKTEAELAVIAKNKAAADKRKEDRKAAFEVVKAFAKKMLEVADSEDVKAITAALKSLAPLRSDSPMVRETIQDKLGRLFAIGEDGSIGRKSVDGYTVYQFESTHWGLSDRRRNAVLAIKTGDADKRMWIDVDPKNDVDTLVHIGKDAPFGWTGFTPIDSE